MKRMLFFILMNSWRTEGNVQPAQGCPCNHKPRSLLDSSCPVPQERNLCFCLVFLVSVATGSLDKNLRLQIWAGSCCTLMLMILRGANWLPTLQQKPPSVSAGSDASKWASAEAELCSGTSEEQQRA